MMQALALALWMSVGTAGDGDPLAASSGSDSDPAARFEIQKDWWAQEADADTVAGGNAEEDEEAKKPRFLGYGWTGTFSAGWSKTSGNTKTESLSLFGETIGRSENTRITLGASYYTNRATDQSTGVDSVNARQAKAWSQFDYFVTEKLYAYATLAGEKDAIQNLDARYNAGAGLGYQWIESDERNLSTAAGAGYTAENYESPLPSNRYASGRASLHFDTKLPKDAMYYLDVDWLPSLEDFNEVQLLYTVTGIRAGLVGTLTLDVRVEWDWNSNPPPGNVRNDTRYIVGLGWTF